METFEPILQISSELGLNQSTSVSVASDPVEERLYIADTGNNRVVVAKLPKPDPLDAWTNAKQNLIAGNIEAALTQFSSTTAESYRRLFVAVGTAKLSQDISAIGQLTPISIDDDEARYYFSRTIGGQQFEFVVTLVKENGLWKIRTF